MQRSSRASDVDAPLFQAGFADTAQQQDNILAQDLAGREGSTDPGGHPSGGGGHGGNSVTDDSLGIAALSKSNDMDADIDDAERGDELGGGKKEGGEGRRRR